MKRTVLKISMLIVASMFVFAGASWADSGKYQHRNSAPEKRVYSKQPDARFYHPPVQYKHKFYHRNKWIQKHRRIHRPLYHYRHGRYYSDNSYDEDPSYNEFSIAATFSEPGVEFSIGSKRTW